MESSNPAEGWALGFREEKGGQRVSSLKLTSEESSELKGV